jgi:hypothetical protein
MVINMLSSNSCIICEDSISDPVCRSCYIKQIEILLNDFKFHPIANEIILRKIKNKFPLESLNDMECILCKKETVTMCRHCFSILLNNILRELNFTEDLIEDFGFNPMYEEIFLERESRPKIEMFFP